MNPSSGQFKNGSCSSLFIAYDVGREMYRCMQFALIGRGRKFQGRSNLSLLISGHGGEASSRITDSTSFVIVPEDVALDTTVDFNAYFTSKQIELIKELGLRCLPSTYVWECIQSQQNLDPSRFQIRMPWDTMAYNTIAAARAINTIEDEEGNEMETEDPHPSSGSRDSSPQRQHQQQQQQQQPSLPSNSIESSQPQYQFCTSSSSENSETTDAEDSMQVCEAVPDKPTIVQVPATPISSLPSNQHRKHPPLLFTKPSNEEGIVKSMAQFSAFKRERIDLYKNTLLVAHPLHQQTSENTQPQCMQLETHSFYCNGHEIEDEQSIQRQQSQINELPLKKRFIVSQKQNNCRCSNANATSTTLAPVLIRSPPPVSVLPFPHPTPTLPPPPFDVERKHLPFLSEEEQDLTAADFLVNFHKLETQQQTPLTYSTKNPPVVNISTLKSATTAPSPRSRSHQKNKKEKRKSAAAAAAVVTARSPIAPKAPRPLTFIQEEFNINGISVKSR